MARFITKAGLIIESSDMDKINMFRAKGLKEAVIEPQPKQEVEVADEYTIRPAKKKKVTISKKKGV